MLLSLAFKKKTTAHTSWTVCLGCCRLGTFGPRRMDPLSHAGWFGHVARLQGRRRPPSKFEPTVKSCGKLRALEKAEKLRKEISASGCFSDKEEHQSWESTENISISAMNASNQDMQENRERC